LVLNEFATAAGSAAAGSVDAAAAESAAVAAGADPALVAAAGTAAQSSAYASAYAAASSSLAGGALQGAVQGFTGSLIASNGDVKAAAQGALSGGITGGISGYFGSNYPVERVLANSAAGGFSSMMRGGKFVDGFKVSFATSALVYLNVQMRQDMIANSVHDFRNDGSYLSRGLFGDFFKLAGGRFNPFAPDGVVQCSPLGCQQNGPGSLLAGTPFEFSYSKGGFTDMVLESYAGPHDFANSPWFYAADGTIKAMSSFEATVKDYLTNYTTSLLFATPFAAAAIAQQTNLSAYWADMNKRKK
jgi:filamentous hemagglutinin